MGRFILGTDFLYKAHQSTALVVLQTKKIVFLIVEKFWYLEQQQDRVSKEETGDAFAIYIRLYMYLQRVHAKPFSSTDSCKKLSILLLLGF